MADKMNITAGVEDVKEAYTPDGDKTYSIRIAGQGRFMVSMKDSGITIRNLRYPENKSSLSWEEFRLAVLADEKKREFKTPEAKPKDKPKEKPKEKPKKVEKAKVEPVQRLEPEEVEEIPKESDMQKSLIQEIETLTNWIKQERWRNARDVAEDIVNRLKHLGG